MAKFRKNRPRTTVINNKQILSVLNDNDESNSREIWFHNLFVLNNQNRHVMFWWNFIWYLILMTKLQWHREILNSWHIHCWLHSRSPSFTGYYIRATYVWHMNGKKPVIKTDCFHIEKDTHENRSNVMKTFKALLNVLWLCFDVV